MSVEWSDERMSIGVPSIDADHRQLIDLINAVEAVVEQKAPSADIERVLAQLAQYVTFHFGREEEMMRKAGYPGLTLHELLHEEFSQRVCQLTAQQFLSNDLAYSKELLGFLSAWLIEHIQQKDRDFLPWLSKVR
jgi:hemerythrin-like metal-binding protein